MRNLVVATDFSERSERAVRRATLLARQCGARLTLVHVVDDDQPVWVVDEQRAASQRLLRQQCDALRDADGITCDFQVFLGAAFAGLASATETIPTDLLVIGSHRRRTLLDIFVGTTAERTIRTVVCPVLMVNALPRAAYQRVLLASDLSQTSRRSVTVFDSLDLAGGDTLTMLHVFYDPALKLARAQSMGNTDLDGYLADRYDRAALELNRFISSLDIQKRRSFKPLVRHEDTMPAYEILSAAREGSADLIVVGTSGRRGLDKLVLGSVASEVLRQADRDVLAIPPGSGS